VPKAYEDTQSFLGVLLDSDTRATFPSKRALQSMELAEDEELHESYFDSGPSTSTRFGPVGTIPVGSREVGVGLQTPQESWQPFSPVREVEEDSVSLWWYFTLQ